MPRWVTLPETNTFSYLKMDGWKMILSFWGLWAYFAGALAGSLGEGIRIV